MNAYAEDMWKQARAAIAAARRIADAVHEAHPELG